MIFFLHYFTSFTFIYLCISTINVLNKKMLFKMNTNSLSKIFNYYLRIISFRVSFFYLKINIALKKFDFA